MVAIAPWVESRLEVRNFSIYAPFIYSNLMPSKSSPRLPNYFFQTIPIFLADLLCFLKFNWNGSCNVNMYSETVKRDLGV